MKARGMPAREAKGTQMLLTHGTDNNFAEFAEEFSTAMGKVYGHLASVIVTNSAYVTPGPKTSDYTPPSIEDDEGDEEPEAISATELKALRLEALKGWYKHEEELRKMYPMFYADMWDAFSVESQQAISNHEDFKDALKDKNPNLLWAIVVSTHLTNIGDDEELTELEEEMVETNFSNLCQGPNQSIGEFAKAFKLGLEKRRVAKLPDFKEPKQAMKFLTKLDQARHGAMVATMTNQRSFPTTLATAYKIASIWKTSVGKAGAGSGVLPVFVIADSVRPPPPPRVRQETSDSKVGGRGGRPPVPDTAPVASVGGVGAFEGLCHNCNLPGHRWTRCGVALKPELRARKAAFDAARAERRGARGARGGDRALVTTAVDDGEDFVDEMLVFTTTTQTDRVMLCSTEVALDTAAAIDVFSNSSLLSGVTRVPQRLLGGINAESDSLAINYAGSFGEFGDNVCVCATAAGNILSMSRLHDEGYAISYDDAADAFRVTGPSQTLVFGRRVRPDGSLSKFYVCDAHVSNRGVLVTTVAGNMAKYTVREVKQAKEARRLSDNLGSPSPALAAEAIARMAGTEITAQDVQRAEDIYGRSLRALRGSTVKTASAAAHVELVPRVVQQEQTLQLDIFFVKGQAFLLGLLLPLGLALCQLLKTRAAQEVGAKIKLMTAAAAARSFDVRLLRCDNEGAVAHLVPNLQAAGVPVELAGPGQHCPEVERRIRTIKERVRGYDASLPFVMCRVLLVYCVLFCVSRLNLVPTASSTSRIPPRELFEGRRLAARDLKFGFGDYVQCTPPNTDNSMASRKEGAVVVLPTGNLTGSVQVYLLATSRVVTRDQITLLPMPDNVIVHLSRLAAADKLARGGIDAPPASADQQDPREIDAPIPLPGILPVGGIPAGVLPADEFIPPEAGVIVDADASNADASPAAADAAPGGGAQPVSDDGAPPTPFQASAPRDGVPPVPVQEPPVQEPPPAPATQAPVDVPQPMLAHEGGASRLPQHWTRSHGARGTIMGAERDALRAVLRREVLRTAEWRDRDLALKVSVKAAMRDRGAEARPVIAKELQQMVDKGVWHGVHLRDLSKQQRKAIIRSSMFLKDKYLASGAFDRFKARLVAGGDQQDRDLYDDISSPTAATASLLTVAAIAAAEGRFVMTADIGGAFLRADIGATGILVHMRLDPLMTSLLLQIDPTFDRFVIRSDGRDDGTSVVQLDKALYGTVEAAKLWYDDLSAKLLADGFSRNPVDPCVFNKIGNSGKQVTIVLHVDDLFVTALTETDLADFEACLRRHFDEVTVHHGRILDYVGMTFDFTETGQVRVTMDNLVGAIIKECGVEQVASTPATANLFEVRDAPKLSATDQAYFRKYVARALYVAKRVKPECLTALSFLTTRSHICDTDDMAKLKRLLAYFVATRERGIVLRVGEAMQVRAYIDAAYGVHTSTGKSQTGCAITIGASGPVYVKAGKQKIVTKSSTEAELVALSDSASQAIHLREFVHGQGYDTGPAVIYQDNMSCIALIKRGGPSSDRSRHISIRHFWVKEKVDTGEVRVEHLRTDKMFSNILTKPLQGAQFLAERLALTNW